MRQVLGVLLALAITVSLKAQSNSEQSDYREAASKGQPAERVSALERFLTVHPQSSLKLDALELLVWNSRTAASLADLEHWTSQLVAISPDNPLAAAIIVGNSLPIANPLPPADRAKRAIAGLDHFDRPEGLSHQDFAGMKNYAIATLNGVVGYSYFEQKNFAVARPYLRKSVELFPDNAQLTYTLALSDLEGNRDEQAEGFRYLARSVNLTQGTSAGESLARYARKKYQDAGGTSADWDKYLAAAPVALHPGVSQPVESANAGAVNPVPAAQPVTAKNHAVPLSRPVPPEAATSGHGTVSSPTMVTNANSVNAASSGVVSSANVSGTAGTSANPAARSSSAPTPGSTASASSASATGRSQPQPAIVPPVSASTSVSATASPGSAKNEIAMATPPPPPPASEPPYRVMPARRAPRLVVGAPMSIGLLIQSALAQKQTRKPIVYSLTDMVRRLRTYDEAFVMSFNKGMVFEEDLTSNDKALESAMDEIAPAPGSAVYDAVTFAAGHLNRIARNQNRVLIVIAGEGDRSSAVSPLELSSELNVSGVVIYCIGLDVYSQSDQTRLQQLSAYTGGRAFFLSAPDQVRSAIRSIASDLGISYPN
jgi:hypothetical protein